MLYNQPVFAKTVIRVTSHQKGREAPTLFRIYGVEQARHVWDPQRLIPRNDNIHEG